VVHKDGREPYGRDVETADIDELAQDNISHTIAFYANQTLRTIALCYKDFDAWPPRDTDAQNEVSSSSHLM